MSSSGEVKAHPPSRLRLACWALPLGLLALLGIALWCATVTSMALMLVTVGMPLSLIFVITLRAFADLHRRWLTEITGTTVHRPYRPVPHRGWITKLKTLLTDPATWRDLAWLIVNATVGFALCLIPVASLLGIGWFLSLPLLFLIEPDMLTVNYGLFLMHNEATSWFAVLPAALCSGVYVIATRPVMHLYSALAVSLLAPTRSAQMVRELTESRAETIDTQAAELRRIERDLHDGTQARLVALGMHLGMAEQLMSTNPAAAQELLLEAQEFTTLTLSELRDLVRGIHPPVLVERGLEGAVRALALSSLLQVEVSSNLPGRPPDPVESAVYFAIAETLTNTIKHSGASSVWITLSYGEGRIGAVVRDDGRGGAKACPGGGLHGIERRLAAFNGAMSIDSPASGPTTVMMELPCELSSVKITPS